MYQDRPKIGSYVDFYDKNGDKQYGRVSIIQNNTVSIDYKHEDTGEHKSVHLKMEVEKSSESGDIEKDFDESKHPRDESGRFGGNGGNGNDADDDNGDSDDPMIDIGGDNKMPESLLDHAKELHEGGMSYKDIVDDLTENDRQGRQWFDEKYNGNQFDLRQDLEGVIEPDKDDDPEEQLGYTEGGGAKEQQRQDTESDEARAQAESDRRQHEPYSQDLKDDADPEHDPDDEERDKYGEKMVKALGFLRDLAGKLQKRQVK